MSLSNLEKAAEVIKSARSVVVLSHSNPDPDAYGSSCGMALGLETIGKKVFRVNESGSLKKYNGIPGQTSIEKVFPAEPYDLLIVCDCGDLKRCGDTLVPLVKAAPFTINIDHHVANENFGNLNIVDTAASSASEIVLKVLERTGVKITRDIATCLYTGLLGDSGSFRYSNTCEETFRTAEKLVSAGAKPDEVAGMVFGNQSLASVRLHGEALASLKLHFDGKLCELVVTAEMMKRCGASSEDTENLVEKGRDIEGILISVVLRFDNGIWRVSLRSKDPAHNVSEIARKFGGGGHVQAAAFRWKQGFEELEKAVLAELEACINQHCNR